MDHRSGREPDRARAVAARPPGRHDRSRLLEHLTVEAWAQAAAGSGEGAGPDPFGEASPAFQPPSVPVPSAMGARRLPGEGAAGRWKKCSRSTLRDITRSKIGRASSWSRIICRPEKPTTGSRRGRLAQRTIAAATRSGRMIGRSGLTGRPAELAACWNSGVSIEAGRAGGAAEPGAGRPAPGKLGEARPPHLR